jgi:putative transposase
MKDGEELVSRNGGKPQQRRRSVRLTGFDYAEPGAYFVTIVAQERSCLFGEIIEGQMQVNRAGEAIARWWLELKRKFRTIETTNLSSYRIIVTE